MSSVRKKLNILDFRSVVVSFGSSKEASHNALVNGRICISFLHKSNLNDNSRRGISSSMTHETPSIRFLMPATLKTFGIAKPLPFKVNFIIIYQ